MLGLNYTPIGEKALLDKSNILRVLIISGISVLDSWAHVSTCFSNERRSTRRCLRETFAVWRKNALASSELRSRAVARLSFSALGLVRGAFCRWRDASRISRAKEKATSMIARLSSGRHSNRAKLRLALRTWRWATFRGSWGENLVDSGGDGNRSPGGKWKQHLSVEVLGLLSELAQDAASSFSLASSVSRAREHTGRPRGVVQQLG